MLLFIVEIRVSSFHYIYFLSVKSIENKLQHKSFPKDPETLRPKTTENMLTLHAPALSGDKTNIRSFIYRILKEERASRQFRYLYEMVTQK